MACSFINFHLSSHKRHFARAHWMTKTASVKAISVTCWTQWRGTPCNQAACRGLLPPQCQCHGANRRRKPGCRAQAVLEFNSSFVWLSWFCHPEQASGSGHAATHVHHVHQPRANVATRHAWKAKLGGWLESYNQANQKDFWALVLFWAWVGLSASVQ